MKIRLWGGTNWLLCSTPFTLLTELGKGLAAWGCFLRLATVRTRIMAAYVCGFRNQEVGGAAITLDIGNRIVFLTSFFFLVY